MSSVIFFFGSLIGPVTSQSFLDLSITCLFFSLCYISFKKDSPFKFQFQPRNLYGFEYGFIFYILAIIVGFLVLKITDHESWQMLLKFNWILNFYIFYWFFKNVEINFNRLIVFFSMAYIIPNIYAIATFIANYDFAHQALLKERRVVGLVNSATYHAHGNALIFVFFSIIYYLNFNSISTKLKTIGAMALTLFFASIFVTMTRGPFISIFVVFSIFLLLNNRKLLYVMLIVGYLGLNVFYAYSPQLQARVQETFDRNSVDPIRVNLLKVHVAMIKDSPVFGIGYTNPLNHTAGWWHNLGLQENYYNSHAHNQLLNVWATTGLLGLIPFMCFYFWFWIKNLQLIRKFKNANMKNHLILAVACLATQSEFIIANFTDIGFEYSKIRSLILVVWALVFALMNDQIRFSSAKKTKN